ncbi:MAG: DUF2851 family protein [Ignavibacteria bacterium]|nr:DUF2851 family protein [Ignavibacteria bacterium]
MGNNIFKYNEIILQKAIETFFQNNTQQFTTTNGKKLQIISIGDFNPDFGPDFRNSCIYIDNEIKIGDVEFHKKSSEWIKHNHHTNPNYNKVILHIILQNDIELTEKIKVKFDTLLLDEKALWNELHKPNTSIKSNEITQREFALLRLLKKTIETYYLLKNNSIEEVLSVNTNSFLSRYFHRRRRYNLYNLEEIQNLTKNIASSNFSYFLTNIYSNKINLSQDEISKLLAKSILNEGKHLRTELFVNVVLPISFCIANNSQKENILDWYWNAKTVCKYTSLYKFFPEETQTYIWQQQALIEILKTNQHKINNDEIYRNEFNFLKNIRMANLNSPPFYMKIN